MSLIHYSRGIARGHPTYRCGWLLGLLSSLPASLPASGCSFQELVVGFIGLTEAVRKRDKGPGCRISCCQR